MTARLCYDCQRPIVTGTPRPHSSAGRPRKRCDECRRKYRAWLHRRYWHQRGGAKLHKHNFLRRERMRLKREQNQLAWKHYIAYGRPGDFGSFKALLLGLPMPARPHGFCAACRDSSPDKGPSPGPTGEC